MAAALLAWRFLLARPHVLIGASFAHGSDAGDVVLRPGQPIRILLALPRAFGAAGLVDLELHQLGDGERVLQVIPVRAAARDDEVVFAMADVAKLVGAARGRFRVVFIRDGQRLAAGEFSVPPP